MEEGLADPLSLAKDASLIKDAQSEYGKMDILICGTCHSVFHFIEEFNSHKSNKCQESIVSQQCENDDKSLTWAFCLWKSREIKDKTTGLWQMFQKWCKLPQEDKDLWIAGGQTILSLNKIRVAKMQEVKFKVKREEEKDPLALTDSDANVLEDKESKTSANKSLLKSPKPNDLPSSGNETPKDELKEYVVESIVGKRFNAKRKNWEYKVKWENFDESQCSWEPMEHLGGCRALINVFEQKIKLDKERKKVVDQAKTKVKTEVKTDDESMDYGNGRRPQRSSKQKALNQVKRWLGEGGSDNEDSKDSRKRVRVDDDSDDMSFEKRMKLEGDSDDSMDDADDDERPKKPTVLKHNTSNGLAGKKLPNNVLIPDAQGIVRINQKQLPSLSSGVYIMSKTAGIIKLDSQTSKIAASGGQAVVKVAPRIGQTHIRIVKKDGATQNRVIQMGQKSKMSSAGSTPRSLVSHKVTKMVRNPTPRLNKSDPTVELEKKKEGEEVKEPQSAADEEDSDSGLPELEFPAEIVPPEPEEPPGEFTLDPTTGKIAGVDYPDHEPEPEISTTTEENKENSESTLDNIVKLAAADITEADLKPDLAENIAEENTDLVTTPQPIVEQKKPEVHKFDPIRMKKDPPLLSKVQQKFMISPTVRSSNILERTLQNPRTVVKSPQGYSRQIYAKASPQRIIHSAMTPKLTSPLVRTVVRSGYVSKPKSVFPKQRFYMSSPSSKLNENLLKQQYQPKANVTKRVGNIGGTTIYKRSVQQQQPKVSMASPKVFQRTNVVRKPVPTVRTVVQKSPKPVINMPSLMDDDLPVQPIADNIQMIQKLEPVQETQETIPVAPSATPSDEISSFAALADGEAPIFITGDDGTVYQVAGQNEQGQTILITQGPDGQQQCLLVTSETAGPDDSSEATEESGTQVTAMMEGAELPVQQTEGMEENNGMEETQPSVQEPLTIKTEPESQSEVVAQFVKAVPPSPGGTPKVMVMLPDGNLVVTPVTAEEYASWQELEK